MHKSILTRYILTKRRGNVRLNENGEEKIAECKWGKGKGEIGEPEFTFPAIGLRGWDITCFTLEQRIMARRAVDNLLGVKFINFPPGDIRSISLL